MSIRSFPNGIVDGRRGRIINIIKDERNVVIGVVTIKLDPIDSIKSNEKTITIL
jgi:hypothetical protein